MLFLAGLPTVARADFINVISQRYEIRGRGTYSGLFPPIQILVDYDEISSTPPIQRRNTVTVLPSSGDPAGGQVTIETFANGGVTGTTAFVETSGERVDQGNAFAAFAEAKASITFMPLESQLLVRTGPGPFEPLFTLGRGFSGIFDDTAGVPILALGPSIPKGDILVSLDLGHIYTMHSSAGDFIGDPGNRLSIQSVPESETVLIFLVTGLGILAMIIHLPKFRRSS